MTQVKLFRLLTGEDVIAELIDRAPGSSPDQMTLKNPVRFIISKDQGAFVKWVELSPDATVNIDKFHVVCIMNPYKQIVDQYLQMHSKIIPAGGASSLILPT